MFSKNSLTDLETSFYIYEQKKTYEGKKKEKDLWGTHQEVIFGSVCVCIHILFYKFSFLSIIFIRQENQHFFKKEFWLALGF